MKIGSLGQDAYDVSKSTGSRGFALTIAALVFGACATPEVSDLDAFDKIPMNRVVPFPTDAELEKRSFEVVQVALPSQTAEADEDREARRQIRRRLRRVVTDAGASIRGSADSESRGIEPSEGPDEGEAIERLLEAGSPADFALRYRVDLYEITGTWKPPFKFLWQSPEEVEGKEGVCTHRADVAFDLEVVEIADDARVLAGFGVEHAVDAKIKELDDSCPLDSALREELFDEAMTDAFSCLRAPLESLLAPRGHVEAHRMSEEGDQHLFLISLGTTQGMAAGDEIEVRREQHASTPAGDAWRTERVIASGVVIDPVRDEEAWAAIDPDQASDEILQGDVVRPVLKEGLLASLSGPNCREIMTRR